MGDAPGVVADEGGSVEEGEGSRSTTTDIPAQVSDGVPAGDGGSKEEGSGARGSRSKRASGGSSRYGHRRSPTTGHRVRRHKTPEPNFVPPDSRQPQDAENRVKRSLSSPGEARSQETRRMSSSEEDEERKSRRSSKPKSESRNKTKVDPTQRISGSSLKTSIGDEKAQTTPVKPSRSKSRGREEKEENGEKGPWWKSWPGWTQKIRGKSLERELMSETVQVAPPRRNKSLERPPVIKEKEKRAAKKKEKDIPPVPMKRNKSKTRTISDEDRRPSVEESSDEFWKSSDGVRERKVGQRLNDEQALPLDTQLVLRDDSSKQLVLVEALVERVNTSDKEEVQFKTDKSKTILKFKKMLDEITSINMRLFCKEIREDWRTFLVSNPGEVTKLKLIRNKCISSFIILVMYCGTGAMIFRFTEGAFENFYKCGVKRVKRDFVDALWTSSHNLREEEWKSQARTKLWEFESQLHTAHEAGMTSYSGLKAWSFMNAFIYCLTVVTTIGYGHISPSTTTGRVITIIYAIFGIPMFLILLADFGKLFTRGIKFIWAFVRRVYYTGSCRRVRRTVPVQEMMKGVQMVYDIATFRRPSQLPPGVTLDDLPPPPPLHLNYTATEPPQRPNYSPGEPPGTPALSTYAIDDEFNLPISVAIFILLIYILSGATVFYVWENWGFFESFYFVFISMSTIGFRDVVPKNQMYMMASIVYLVFGLALTSMCINVVQEKLSDSFRQASAKIGATIGLRVTEEDGAVTPVPPPAVEVPEVHRRSTLSEAS